MTKLFILANVCLSVVLLDATAKSQTVPFSPEHWEIRAEESRITDHLGRETLFLKGGLAMVTRQDCCLWQECRDLY